MNFIGRLFPNFALIFGIICLVNFLLDGLLIDVVFSRASVVYLDGLGASNRDYIYEYIDGKKILSLIGLGFGNPQVDLANHVGSDEVASLLNLYLNILMGAGVVGFILLLIIIMYPGWIVFGWRGEIKDTFSIFILFSAYFAWLIAFFVHSEEFSFMFAVLYGLIIYRFKGVMDVR